MAIGAIVREMNRTSLLTLAASVAAVAVAPAALAAPAVTTPPSIRGEVRFGETVSCDPGQWSGAVAFRYDWMIGGSSRGTGRTFAIDEPYYGGVPLSCQVTATDAAGESATASSPGVVPGRGRISVKITSFRAAKRGRIVVTGKLGPSAMLTRWGGAEVILRRSVPRERNAVFQLSDAVRAKRDGSFRVVGIDAPGRWAIRLDVYADAIQLYDAAQVTRRLTISRGGRGCGGCSVLR